MKKLTLAELKTQFGSMLVEKPHAHRPIRPLLASGDPHPQIDVPKGTMIEVLGPQRTEWIVHYLLQHPQKRVAWIESQRTIFPTALFSRQLNLSQIIFLTPKPNELEWTIATVLQSQVFQIGITALPQSRPLTDTQMRRFQILAKRSGTTMLCPTAKRFSTWTIPFSIEAKQYENQLQATLLRKGQKVG